MEARKQAEWQPTKYRFPTAPVSMLSLPNPTAGIEAFSSHCQERAFPFAKGDIPSRASFLVGLVESGLVSEPALERLAADQSLASMEMALSEGIETFSGQFRLKRNPFTKTAKRHLKRIGLRPSELRVEQTHILLSELVEANVLDPHQVLQRLPEGDRAVDSLVADATHLMRQGLPENYSVHLTAKGLTIACHNTLGIDLDLPTDVDGPLHALRIAVMNALAAISEGIAGYNDPQMLYSVNGRFQYYFDEMWSQLKSSVRGMTLEEITDWLADQDPDSWEFEVYNFGVDDPSEVEPGSEAFEQMANVLHELAVFERNFAIDFTPYESDRLEATCAEQVALMKGFAESYPEHREVYEALIEAFESSARFHASGMSLEALCKHGSIDQEESTLERDIPPFHGLFVNPCRLETLGQEVDTNITDTFGNLGLPMVTIPIEQGLVTHLANPMLMAIKEANRLITMIASAVGELDHA